MRAISPDTFVQAACANPLVRLVQWSFCAGAALHMAFAPAQPQAKAPDIVHQVQAGETLYELAERYTGQSSRWPELQRHNRIANPHRIATGIHVQIPVELLASAPAFATVAYVTGDVRQIRPGETQARPLQADEQLPQGTRIEVGSNGFVRLQMADGSVARIPAGSLVRLTSVQHQEATHTTRTLIQMEAGRVDATVSTRRNKSSQFEIHTPLAIASVRGTEFGVAIQPDATVTSEVTQGVVSLQVRRRGHDHRDSWSSQQLRAGQGASVNSTGVVGPIRRLPEAPDLSALPVTVTDADFVRLPLPAMAGVAAYRVRVSSDEALEQVVRDGMIRDRQIQFAGLDDGIYMVGVRAIDNAGLMGGESRHALRVKARPIAPLFQRPTPDEKVVGNAIDLACTQPVEAQRFRLQIAKDETFEMLEVDESALTECRHQATLPPGQHFWRVASVRLVAGTPDQGPFSGGQRFELVAPPPGEPTPTISSDDEALRIHWTGAPGYRYLVQVARDSGFAELVHNETRTEALLRLPGQTPGTYYVRIQAIDAQGQAGAFSPAQAVQIGAVLRDSSGNAVRDSDGKAVGRQ
jgi:hypothetical protein